MRCDIRERVSHLVLYGGFARGSRKRGPTAATRQADAMLTLMRHGWGRENPAFRQIFTSRFVPGGTPEQMQWFNDLQRMTDFGRECGARHPASRDTSMS